MLYAWRAYCASCKKDMVLRENKKTHEKFWGCVNYPKCKWTVPYEIPSASKGHKVSKVRDIPDRGNDGEYEDEPGFLGSEGPFKWS